MAESVAILGATSSIGRALALRFAASGAHVVLAGRDLEELERTAKDLTLRTGADARAVRFDALDFDAHAEVVEELAAACPDGLDGAVLVYAEQAEQQAAEADFAVARRMIDLNYASAISLLERLGARLEARGRGFLCAVTSVAGDRGRPSNYLYGSTKAALSVALDGMRARLASKGVRVVNAKPGFVDTRLTYGRPGIFLAARPERVARDIERAIRRDRRVVYTPWWWRFVMIVIRAVPDFVFKRLSL